MRGDIYLLKHDGEILWVGSSEQYKIRIGHHQSCVVNEYEQYYNHKLYEFIRSIGGWEKVESTIIDTMEFTDKRELRALEQEYIEKLFPKYNILNALLTVEIRKKQKQKSDRKYFETHREKHYEYQRQHRSQQRRYRKKIYQEKLKPFYTEKIKCECGSIVGRSGMAKHRRTNKHFKNLNERSTHLEM